MAGGVPARGLVRETPVQHMAFELTFLLLVQRAHAHVPDPLSSHPCSNPHSVRVSSGPSQKKVETVPLVRLRGRQSNSATRMSNVCLVHLLLQPCVPMCLVSLAMVHQGVGVAVSESGLKHSAVHNIHFRGLQLENLSTLMVTLLVFQDVLVIAVST